MWSLLILQEAARLSRVTFWISWGKEALIRTYLRLNKINKIEVIIIDQENKFILMKFILKFLK